MRGITDFYTTIKIGYSLCKEKNMDLAQVTFTELTKVNIILRVMIVCFLSGCLGIERTRKRRGAGVRTYMMVAVGAALTMMTSQFIYVYIGQTDIARLGAQVISGIGFIGAGTIMFTGFKQVKGITTAAGLWASACIGLAVGIGFIYGAVLSWFIMVFIMTILEKWEKHYYADLKEIRIFTVFETFKDFRHFIRCLKKKGNEILDFEIDKNGMKKEISTYVSIQAYREKES